MRLYFTDAQVPEMSDISRSQRRVVRRGGYEMFCQEKPSRRRKVRLVNFFALFMGLGLAREFGRNGSTHHAWWLGPLIIAVTVFAIELPFQSFLTERLRPYFRRYLSEHRNEIGQAG